MSQETLTQIQDSAFAFMQDACLLLNIGKRGSQDFSNVMATLAQRDGVALYDLDDNHRVRSMTGQLLGTIDRLHMLATETRFFSAQGMAFRDGDMINLIVPWINRMHSIAIFKNVACDWVEQENIPEAVELLKQLELANSAQKAEFLVGFAAYRVIKDLHHTDIILASPTSSSVIYHGLYAGILKSPHFSWDESIREQAIMPGGYIDQYLDELWHLAFCTPVDGDGSEQWSLNEQKVREFLT